MTLVKPSPVIKSGSVPISLTRCWVLGDIIDKSILLFACPPAYPLAAVTITRIFQDDLLSSS